MVTIPELHKDFIGIGSTEDFRKYKPVKYFSPLEKIQLSIQYVMLKNAESLEDKRMREIIGGRLVDLGVYLDC